MDAVETQERHKQQITKVRAVLARHHARLMKYIDTWTTAELVP